MLSLRRTLALLSCSFMLASASPVAAQQPAERAERAAVRAEAAAARAEAAAARIEAAASRIEAKVARNHSTTPVSQGQSTTPILSRAVLSNEADGASMEVFAPSTPAIYVSVEVDNLWDGALIKANLIFKENGTEYQVTGATETTVLGGPSRMTFDFTAPTNGWPKGNYKMDIMSDAMLLTTLPFRVK